MKRRQLLHSLAQSCFESAIAGQRGLEPEDFPRGCARVVEHEQTIAKTVRVSLRVPGGQVRFAALCRRQLVDDEIVRHAHGINILVAGRKASTRSFGCGWRRLPLCTNGSVSTRAQDEEAGGPERAALRATRHCFQPDAAPARAALTSEPTNGSF